MSRFTRALTSLFRARIASGGLVSKHEETIRKLEVFMNRRLPTGASAVLGFEMSVEGCVLTKTTLIMGGESHSRMFRLDGAEFTIERGEIEPQAVKFYGFQTYWDVHIDGQWIHSEMPVEKDAQELIALLKAVQSECAAAKESYRT